MNEISFFFIFNLLKNQLPAFLLFVRGMRCRHDAEFDGSGNVFFFFVILQSIICYLQNGFYILQCSVICKIRHHWPMSSIVMPTQTILSLASSFLQDLRFSSKYPKTTNRIPSQRHIPQLSFKDLPSTDFEPESKWVISVTYFSNNRN